MNNLAIIAIIRRVVTAGINHRAALAQVDATTPGTPERRAACNALVLAEREDDAAFRAFNALCKEHGVQPGDRMALVELAAA